MEKVKEKEKAQGKRTFRKGDGTKKGQDARKGEGKRH